MGKYKISWFLYIDNIINSNLILQEEKKRIEKIKQNLFNKSKNLQEKIDELYAINKFLQLKESNMLCEMAKQAHSKINIQKIINKQYKNNNYIFLN